MDMAVKACDPSIRTALLEVLVADKVCESLVSFWRRMTYLEVCFCDLYSKSMPGVAFGLVRSSPEVRDRTKLFMNSLWAALDAFERQVEPGTSAQWLRWLDWPQNHYSRELLLSLQESDGACLPDDVLQDFENPRPQ